MSDSRQDGKRLTLGIRPESLSVGSEASAVSLPFSVEMIELTGPEMMATGQVGGRHLVACLSSRSTIEEGAKIRLAADPDAMHLFDPETGRAV